MISCNFLPELFTLPCMYLLKGELHVLVKGLEIGECAQFALDGGRKRLRESESILTAVNCTSHTKRCCWASEGVELCSCGKPSKHQRHIRLKSRSRLPYLCGNDNLRRCSDWLILLHELLFRLGVHLLPCQLYVRSYHGPDHRTHAILKAEESTPVDLERGGASRNVKRNFASSNAVTLAQLAPTELS